MGSVRRVVAAIAIAFIAAGALAPAVCANGLGDLYAATPAGVLELRVDTQTVVNTVPIAPSPIGLAFANDGLTLFTVSGGRHIARIDIESISLKGQRDVPQNAVAVAVPKGDAVVVAYPSTRSLGAWDPTSDSLSQSPPLPGGPDLLAANRRDPRVVAAQAGKSWVAAWDPAGHVLKTSTVTGRVAAIAIDRERGAAFVATAAPDRIYRLDLSTLAVDWSAALPAAPSGIAVLVDRVVVGGGTTLWVASASGTMPWATAAGAFHQLVGSDEGSVVYAAESSRIEAFSRPGTAARTFTLTGRQGPVAIAPVQHASSIAGGGGGATSSSQPAQERPVPPTSTTPDDVGRWIARTPLVGPALGTGLATLGMTFVIARWYVRRQPEG